MTSASINNFVGDLVAMAQAMERLPQVEADLTALQRSYDASQEIIARREASILSYKSEIETLNQRIRSLEVERDDAGFRALELEDKASSVLASLGNILANVNDARLTLDPPKPAPVAPAESTIEDIASAMQPGNVEYIPAGQSEVPPTPPTGATTDQSPTPPSLSNNGESYPPTEFSPSTDPASGPDTTPPRSLTEADIVEATKYKGVNYWTLPGWISETDWAAGGGDMSNYHLGSRSDPRFGEGSEVGPGF